MVARKVITAVATSIVFLAWGVLSAQSTTQDPVTRPTTASNIIRLERCQTYWADERVISSKIPGKIDRRRVNDGQAVEEGDLLATLDSRDAEIEFAIQDILGNSDLDEQSQKEKLNEYLARLDAAGKLVGRRAISEEEYRLAQVNVQVNRFMALKEAEKRVVEQKKAERARVFLQDHEIRSPIRGIIKKCFKREKESVTSNDLQLFHIVASDKVWVEGMAPVNALYRVRVGQKVDVKLVIPEPERSIGEPRKGISSGVPSAKSPVDGDRSPESRVELPQEKLTFQGTIVYIDPNADPSGGVFRVRAEVDNQFDPETGDPVLRAGLNTNMKIYLNAQAERN